MITSSREAADLTAKQQGNTSDNGGKLISNKLASSTATTTPASWLRLKDPRIVRVSRAFGGKDRHSKVCTVRGLRDRRVRLSVQTAIQLYDLQDRLRLNQPSKVVDWLLNVAKHEIDELPPLQMPPGNFAQNLEPMLATSHGVISPNPPQSEKLEGFKINTSLNWEDNPLELSRSNYWNSPDKSKEVARETSQRSERNEEGKRGRDHDHDHNGAFASSSDFTSRTNHSSLPGLLNNVMPNNSFLRWDPSNLSLSQVGGHEGVVHYNFNLGPTLSSSNMSSGSQFLLYPATQTQPYFPSSGSGDHHQFDPKQFNFQMLSSASSQNQLPTSSFTPPLYTINQAMRPNFQLTMNPKFFPSQDNNGNEPNKG